MMRGMLWTWLLCGSWVNRVYKWFKFFLRQITGKCELERICTSGNGKTYEINIALAASFNNSLEMNHLRLPRQDPEFNTSFFIDSIRNIKSISEKTVTCVHEWVVQENEIQSMLEKLSTLTNEAYSSCNSQHEKTLEQLWQLLKPGITKSGRLTKQWQEIGFQGNDPQTDFRSMGILGLCNLVYFATTYPENSISILEKRNFNYPFAIGGISITKNLLDLCKKGKFDMYFFKHGANLKQFNELYSKATILFSEYYELQQPPNIMHFESIMKKFVNEIPHLVK